MVDSSKSSSRPSGRRNFTLAVLLLTTPPSALLAACGDDDKPDPVLLNVDPEPPGGGHCSFGGHVISYGADRDRDGVLDGDEVSGRLTVCGNGVARLDPPGSALPTDTSSSTSSSGAGGAAGATGSAGEASSGSGGVGPDISSGEVLVRIDRVPPGKSCEYGGRHVQVGRDDDADGQLSEPEVSHSELLCYARGVTPSAGLASDLVNVPLTHESAYIPPPCYTKTEDDDGTVHNPCYTCHTRGDAPNFTQDDDLQLWFSFPAPARNNPWQNLFVDREEATAAQSDEEILAYVRQSNYFDAFDIRLSRVLANVPSGWDVNGNGRWDGFVPDCEFAFDERGFDRLPDGRYSGWRAFAYDLFPGTFWPTNGSTDDVLIRLAPAFRNDEQGRFDIAVYQLNLAIVEALIKRRDVAIPETDENLYGVDLDGDGELGSTALVKYDWQPREGRDMSYVGQARLEQQSGQQYLAAGLFPLGTEFLHSVRYIDLRQGAVALAPRMKELRYARKVYWRTYAQLNEAASAEIKEKYDFPDRLHKIPGDVEAGVNTGKGWRYQGFIEDADGELRPQTYEELLFCAGCHSGLGVTTDGIFSFPRKFDATAHQQGWYHWTQHGLADHDEPKWRDGQTWEYTSYLEHNGAGDELRQNEDVLQLFFDADGRLSPERTQLLHDDVTLLIMPSASRAIELDKAYRTIVREQSFVRGREATLEPAENVHRSVPAGLATGVSEPLLP